LKISKNAVSIAINSYYRIDLDFFRKPYIVLFVLLLAIVWSRLDNPSIIAIASVLAGGLAGVIGTFIGSVIGLRRVERESEDRLKQYASKQALELTKLEFGMRRETGQQKQFYAPAKVYREFYKALFELYSTKEWPKQIEEMGLLNILDYTKAETKKKE